MLVVTVLALVGLGSAGAAPADPARVGSASDGFGAGLVC
jgi:hypothetical protein